MHDPSDLLEIALTKFRLEPDLYDELTSTSRNEVFSALSERQGKEIKQDSLAYMALKTEEIGFIEDYLADENVPKRFYVDQLSSSAGPLMLGVPYDHV